MSFLPTITHPTFRVTIPSTKEEVECRPFLVREEKILLMARESNDKSDVLDAIRKVVTACVVTKIDIDSLTLFDLEYLFLKIRAASVSNKATVGYQDIDDKKTYTFEIDLDQVEIRFPENVEKDIKISDKVGIAMKYPSASLYADKAFLKLTGEELIEALIVKSIDKVYDGENVTDLAKLPPNALKVWLENLDVKVYNQMKTFLNSLPSLYYKITYTNANGDERTVELTTIADFFSF